METKTIKIHIPEKFQDATQEAVLDLLKHNTLERYELVRTALVEQYHDKELSVMVIEEYLRFNMTRAVNAIKRETGEDLEWDFEIPQPKNVSSMHVSDYEKDN